MPTQQIGELTFDSDFDSGNGTRFEQTDDNEFSLFTSNDAHGTEFEKGFRTWFHFSVRGISQRGRQLTFLVYVPSPGNVAFALSSPFGLRYSVSSRLPCILPTRFAGTT